MAARRHVEVAIVGGGPAGAALAIRLAATGHEVALFERLARPRWRASGVYSSPLTRGRLRELGIDGRRLSALIRPIRAMVVETADGRARCALDYEPLGHACGVDRVRLEEALLDLARAAGALVREGASVLRVQLGGGPPAVLVSDADGAAWWTAGVVVGADGAASIVGRAARVSRPARRFRRAALTGHRLDPDAAPADEPMAARMVVGDGWYLGIAPVPGGRTNLGLVLGEGQLRRELARGASADDLLDGTLEKVLGPGRRLRGAPPTDEVRAHLPLVHRVSSAAGGGFVLVGDAAGFIDPLSGEGLHRALVSAELAAAAIAKWSAGDRSSLSDYDRHLRARFRSKDVVSWFLQFFAANPALAGYALRRLARRGGLRRVLAERLADVGPPSSLVDPRYVVRVLAP